MSAGLVIGFFSVVMDVVTIKLTSTVMASGFRVVPWVQVHKWGTYIFSCWAIALCARFKSSVAERETKSGSAGKFNRIVSRYVKRRARG